MLKLVTYPAAFGEPSASMFCVKAMCFLEMAGATWEVEESGDPRKTPKKKLPLLKDGDSAIPDSEDIRTYLQEKYDVDFDEGLNDAERAISRAVIRMCDEHLYFILICERWVNDENWAVIQEEFFGMIPKILRRPISNQIRKSAIAGVNGQGVGRHSVQERFERADKDIEAIMALVGDKPFLFGDKATAADASAGPILASLAGAPNATQLSARVKNDPKIIAYIARVREAIYPK